jgi:hypothetical protein
MRGLIARPYHLDEDREKIDVAHTWQSQTPASRPVPFGDAERYHCCWCELGCLASAAWTALLQFGLDAER